MESSIHSFTKNDLTYFSLPESEKLREVQGQLDKVNTTNRIAAFVVGFFALMALGIGIYLAVQAGPAYFAQRGTENLALFSSGVTLSAAGIGLSAWVIKIISDVQQSKDLKKQIEQLNNSTYTPQQVLEFLENYQGEFTLEQILDALSISRLAFSDLLAEIDKTYFSNENPLSEPQMGIREGICKFVGARRNYEKFSPAFASAVLHYVEDAAGNEAFLDILFRQAGEKGDIEVFAHFPKQVVKHFKQNSKLVTSIYGKMSQENKQIFISEVDKVRDEADFTRPIPMQLLEDMQPDAFPLLQQKLLEALGEEDLRGNGWKVIAEYPKRAAELASPNDMLNIYKEMSQENRKIFLTHLQDREVDFVRDFADYALPFIFTERLDVKSDFIGKLLLLHKDVLGKFVQMFPYEVASCADSAKILELFKDLQQPESQKLFLDGLEKREETTYEAECAKVIFAFIQGQENEVQVKYASLSATLAKSLSPKEAAAAVAKNFQEMGPKEKKEYLEPKNPEDYFKGCSSDLAKQILEFLGGVEFEKWHLPYVQVLSQVEGLEPYLVSLHPEWLATQHERSNHLMHYEKMTPEKQARFLERCAQEENKNSMSTVASECIAKTCSAGEISEALLSAIAKWPRQVFEFFISQGDLRKIMPIWEKMTENEKEEFYRHASQCNSKVIENKILQFLSTSEVLPEPFLQVAVRLFLSSDSIKKFIDKNSPATKKFALLLLEKMTPDAQKNTIRDLDKYTIGQKRYDNLLALLVQEANSSANPRKALMENFISDKKYKSRPRNLNFEKIANSE